MFIHNEGFLCRWRPEPIGQARTNWAKKGDMLVLEIEAEDIHYICEPIICPGKANAAGTDMCHIQEGMDAARIRKDYGPILKNDTYKPLFYTPGDNGHGYRVEILS